MLELSVQLAAAVLARARSSQAARNAFISARSTTIRGATPLYFFVAPVTSRLTSPPLAAFRCRRLSRIISNNGLNSKAAFDESTAINSSVMLSGARRVKEMPERLDIQDYRPDSENSDPARFVRPSHQRSRSLSVVPLAIE